MTGKSEDSPPSHAPIEPTFEYACQAFDLVSKGDGWRVVGAGPGSLWTARNDYAAWKRGGYAVRIVCRPVAAWSVTDQTFSPPADARKSEDSAVSTP